MESPVRTLPSKISIYKKQMNQRTLRTCLVEVNVDLENVEMKEHESRFLYIIVLMFNLLSFLRW